MNLPWFVRWGTDVALFFIPALTFANYPTTFFVFAAEKRRQRRRKDFSDVKLRDDSAFSVDQVKQLQTQLHLKQ
ncbi:hypothetical protein ABPG72_002071 [Tetrahymena utriculariae]